MNEEELQAKIKENPDNKEGYKKLCEYYAQQKNYTSLALILDEALSRFPKAPFFYQMRASLWISMQQWGKAVKDFQIVLSLNPNDSGSYDSLGVLYQKMNQYQKAHMCHEKAVSLNSDHPGFVFNLAVAAEKTGRIDQAQKIYRMLLKHIPDHKAALINLAVIEEKNGNFDKAEQLFKKAADMGTPDFALCMGLGNMHRRKEEREEAVRWYEKALSLKPNDPVAQFMVQHMKGETPDIPPESFVSGLFDDFAADFDHKLLKTLQYQTPQHMMDILQPVLSDKTGIALDLGCGTGLLGKLLKPYIDKITGVDLSQKMLAKAAQTECYDELVCGDILAFLKEAKDASYDLITAADVFVYLGNLKPVVTEMNRALKPGCYCLFSVEAMKNEEYTKNAERGFVLRETARYAHSKEYLEEIAAEAGLVLQVIKEKTIRLNKGKPIQGYLTLCKKAS